MRAHIRHLRETQKLRGPARRCASGPALRRPHLLQRLAARDPARLIGVEIEPRQRRDQGIRRQQQRVPLVPVSAPPAAASVTAPPSKREASDRRAPQRGQAGAAAELPPDVLGEHADVGALAARDRQFELVPRDVQQGKRPAR